MTGPYARAEVDPTRHRCRPHLDFVKGRPCCVPTCRADRRDPHHLTHIQAKARGETAGDQWAVALCRTHHNALHAMGDEAKWWRVQLVNPVLIAGRLWAASIAAGRFKPESPAEATIKQDLIVQPADVRARELFEETMK